MRREIRKDRRCFPLIINIQRASSMNSLGLVARNSASCGSEQTRTTDSLPPAAHGDSADALLGGRGNMLPVLFTVTHTLSCLSLRTCSVLFQLMSTAGPPARCSEFNERNYLGGLFFVCVCVCRCFCPLFAQQQTGQSVNKRNWCVIEAFYGNQSVILNTNCVWHYFSGLKQQRV